MIVENASKDSELLKKDQFLNENTIILYAQENKGFSDGNNIGIKYRTERSLFWFLYSLFLKSYQSHSRTATATSIIFFVKIQGGFQDRRKIRKIFSIYRTEAILFNS